MLFSQIIGHLITLKIYICNCTWNFSNTFFIHPFCEVLCWLHDIIKWVIHNRLIFVLHINLWIIESFISDVLIIAYFKCFVSWASIVSIATQYGWMIWGVNPGVCTRFSALGKTPPGVHPASCMVGTGFVSSGKSARAGHSWPVLG